MCRRSKQPRHVLIGKHGRDNANWRGLRKLPASLSPSLSKLVTQEGFCPRPVRSNFQNKNCIVARRSRAQPCLKQPLQILALAQLRHVQKAGAEVPFCYRWYRQWLCCGKEIG